MCDTRRAPGGGPRWTTLYGIVALAIVALGFVEAWAPPVVAALRFAVGGVAFGAMAWWVRSTRAALDQLEWCACASSTLSVRVIASRPGPAPPDCRRPRRARKSVTLPA